MSTGSIAGSAAGRWREEHEGDLGLLAQSIMPAAQYYGVDSATAITLAAHPDLIRKELKIPDDLSIVIGIAVGHADPGHPQNQYRSPRRTVREAVRFLGI